MNETLKKFTAEIRAKIAESFQSPDIRSIVEATKAATDNGTFEVVISTDNIDRQGESIKQDGWDLSFYKLNPVVLWGHDYYSLPIGICDEITVSGGKLTAKGRFAPEEANPFAQQVRRLYDLKIVRATSVGFIVLEAEGDLIIKAELLEFSFVPVPANPYALSLSQAKELHLDFAMLETKGLKLEAKDEKSIAKAEGDECEMPDGSMGEMHPNDAGEMVCMVKKSKAPALGDECELPDGGGMGTMQDDGNGGMVCKPNPEPEPEKTAEELATEADAKLLDDAKIFFKIDAGSVKDAQQIGAILAQLQNVIDNALIMASRLILDIVQSEYGQSDAGKTAIAEVIKSNSNIASIKITVADLEQKLGIGEGEERHDGDAPNERSQDTGFKESMKSVDEFLMTRNILKSVVTSANQALERMNEKARQYREARRSH